MQKITHANYPEIYPYSQSRKETLCFWHDQGYLRSYEYVIRDGVLYVYKPIPYNKQMPIFLALPPLTLNNDYQKEADLLHAQDITVSVTNNDLENYSFTTFPNIRHSQDEYIYSTDTYENLFTTNSNWRHAINKIKRKGFTFEVLVYDKDNFLSGSRLRDTLKEAKDITRQWSEETDNDHKDKFYHIDAFESLYEGNFFTVRNPAKKLVGYFCTQLIGNTVFLSAYKTLKSEFGNLQISKAFFYEVGKHYREKYGRDFFMNFGTGVDSGLAGHKDTLHHSKILKIYKIDPVKNG